MYIRMNFDNFLNAFRCLLGLRLERQEGYLIYVYKNSLGSINSKSFSQHSTNAKAFVFEFGLR
jgi:hypothetical protein